VRSVPFGQSNAEGAGIEPASTQLKSRAHYPSLGRALIMRLPYVTVRSRSNTLNFKVRADQKKVVRIRTTFLRMDARIIVQQMGR
jgi:hypothetical protein